MKSYIFALLFVLSMLVMNGYALGGSAKAQALSLVNPEKRLHQELSGTHETTAHIESGLAEEIINSNRG